MSLEVKSPVVSGEARSTFRVPIYPDFGLQVRITRGESEWVAQPINISLGGILVELSETKVPDFEIDDQVDAQLRLDDKVADLSAIVRRREGSRYSLMFTGILQEGEIEPPRSLSDITRELERRWLSRRVPNRG